MAFGVQGPFGVVLMKGDHLASEDPWVFEGRLKRVLGLRLCLEDQFEVLEDPFESLEDPFEYLEDPFGVLVVQVALHTASLDFAVKKFRSFKKLITKVTRQISSIQNRKAPKN